MQNEPHQIRFIDSIHVSPSKDVKIRFYVMLRAVARMSRAARRDPRCRRDPNCAIAQACHRAQAAALSRFPPIPRCVRAGAATRRTADRPLSLASSRSRDARTGRALAKGRRRHAAQSRRIGEVATASVRCRRWRQPGGAVLAGTADAGDASARRRWRQASRAARDGRRARAGACGAARSVPALRTSADGDEREPQRRAADRRSRRGRARTRRPDRRAARCGPHAWADRRRRSST